MIIAVARSLHRAGAPAIALVAAVLGPGCGSSEPRLSATTASQLQRGLSDVRAAAEDGDETEALRALSSFSALVGQESRAGNLSAAQTRGFRTGIAQARRRIELEVAAPAPARTPPPALTTPPVPAPEQPGEPEEEEKEEKEEEKGEKGKGKSKGKGGKKD